MAQKLLEMKDFSQKRMDTVVYPIADTSGDFKRLYGCNFAENRPETIH